MKQSGKKRRDRIAAGIEPVDLPYGFRLTLIERESLRRLAASADTNERKLCAAYLSWADVNPVNCDLLFELCDKLIADRWTRWAVLVILRPFTQSHPAQCWRLVEKWGGSKSFDIRGAIAVCVLEHVFEHHFADYFPNLRQIIEAGNKRFLYTLAACYKLGQAEEPKNARQINELVNQHRPFLMRYRNFRKSLPITAHDNL